MLLLLIGFLAVVNAQTDGERIFDWARENGVYIHKCLEYRDNGIYTNCCIGNDTVLMQVPSKLYIRHNTSWVSIRDNIANRYLYPDANDLFYDYFDSVELDCYSAICNPERMTVAGFNFYHQMLLDGENLDELMLLAASTAYSRIWEKPLWALVPVVDLLNHGFDKQAESYPTNDSFTIMTGEHYYVKDEEIYIDYGVESPADLYIMYNIETANYEPNCDEYSLIRWRQFPEKRIECIMNMTDVDLIDIELEMVGGYKYNDTDMIVATRAWMELFWRDVVQNRSEETNTLNPR